MRGYSDLEVWRKAMDLAVVVYGLARAMPKTEQFAMTSQMTRAATSIASNIAEGYQRSSRRDYARFISIARGSQAELETLLLLARRVGLYRMAMSSPLSQPPQKSAGCSADCDSVWKNSP